MAPASPSASPSRAPSHPAALQCPAVSQAWGWAMSWVEMHQNIPFIIQMHSDTVTVKVMLLTTDSAKQPSWEPRAGFASTMHLLRAEIKLSCVSHVPLSWMDLHPVASTLGAYWKLCSLLPTQLPAGCTFRDIWEVLVHLYPSSAAESQGTPGHSPTGKNLAQVGNPGEKHRNQDRNLPMLAGLPQLPGACGLERFPHGWKLEHKSIAQVWSAESTEHHDRVLLLSMAPPGHWVHAGLWLCRPGRGHQGPVGWEEHSHGPTGQVVLPGEGEQGINGSVPLAASLGMAQHCRPSEVLVEERKAFLWPWRGAGEGTPGSWGSLNKALYPTRRVQLH